MHLTRNFLKLLLSPRPSGYKGQTLCYGQVLSVYLEVFMPAVFPPAAVFLQTGKPLTTISCAGGAL